MDPPPQPTPQRPSPGLPRLALLPPSKTPPVPALYKRINTGADLPHFLSSLAYREIGIFILQLNRALCPRKPSPASSSNSTTSTTKIQTFPLDAPRADPEPVTQLRALLHKVEAIIDEVPPEKGPRRFGNASVRRWGERLESRVEGLLREHLPGRVWEEWGEGAMVEVKGYFLGGFGSFERLDYGTGHELSFLAFLGGLWKLGVFGGGGDDGTGDGEVERCLVLGVFEP
jgi:serine/threonine-protein phosphatase 2A activator